MPRISWCHLKHRYRYQSIKQQEAITINFGFTPKHRWLSALYTQYLPEFCGKKSQAYYLNEIRTHGLCNSRAESYQVDLQDCLVAKAVARGSSNPIFWQRVSQRFNRCLYLHEDKEAITTKEFLFEDPLYPNSGTSI